MLRPNSPTRYTRERLKSPSGALRAPTEEEATRHRISVEGRLLSTLDGWRQGDAKDPEFLPLVGQLIRWAGGDSEEEPISMYVPPGRVPHWSAYGIKVVGFQGGAQVLACALDEVHQVGEDFREAIVRACRQEVLQTPLPVLGDPWINLTSHGRLGVEATLPRFKTDGQRRLIRALDALDPSSQILIGCLPTGEGKSLSIHRLVVQSKRLVLVVVPTVTLAQDQEIEALQVLEGQGLPKELAYLGGDGAREDIRTRIRGGDQRLVFANPESLRALLPALMEAAREGNLEAVVVDEAHVIDADGWEFRPDFGLIPSIVRALTGQVPQSKRAPKVVLLSATLTQATVANLKLLFGGEGREVILAGSLRLRPEPAYVGEEVEAEGEEAAEALRRKRVLDVLPLLPRPLYLYSTTKDDVEYYLNALKELGLNRVRHVHGGVDATDRHEVIRAVREQEVDVVSANSAFGLGLNVPDIRTVVHACVPESLDRFSQEVGRGGRDRRATISWLVTTRKDRVIARNQGFRKILKDKGGPRWRDLKASSLEAGPGRLWVRMDSDRNKNETSRRWALATIVLMQACGLLEVVWDQERPEGVEFEDLCVRLVDPSVDEVNWIEKTADLRNAINTADLEARECFWDVLDGKVALEEALRKTYALRRPDGEVIRPPRIRPKFADRTAVVVEEPIQDAVNGRVRVVVADFSLPHFIVQHAETLCAPPHRYRHWMVESALDHELLTVACQAMTPATAGLVRFAELDDDEWLSVRRGQRHQRWVLFTTSRTLSWGEIEALAAKYGEGLVVCSSDTESPHPGRTLEDEIGRALTRFDDLRASSESTGS
jgi:superfamily II DNA or RNA helicase